MNRFEKRIATALINTALTAGLKVSIYDGDEWVVKSSSDFNAIFDALASTDSDTLRFRRADGSKIGSVELIWGNGEDLISDHTDNEETTNIVRRAERSLLVVP